jgi:G3E family GTPase
VRPAGVVAAVDALRIEDLLASQPEVRRQLEFADRVVLTKSDLAPQRVADALRFVEEAAPGCEVRAAEHGRIDSRWLFAAPPLARVIDAPGAHRWLHHHASDAGPTFRSHAIELEAAADVQALELWLRLVTQLDGPRLLRIKGLVEDRASGDLFALQAAGRSVSPARRLARTPDGPRGVRFVIVERGFGAAPLERLLASLDQAARA